KFSKKENINPEHIVIGNLSSNSIPEIVLFKEKDSGDINDEGSLEVYKFDGEKYSFLDKVSMNYDNTNYELVIGQIAKGQNGIYLNNQVGSQSGITYGFILQEDKLVSILNEKKINLISTSTDNEIKDINNDGILEFSVYTVDPESEDQDPLHSDKIKLWYKWDGKDGANLVKTENFKESNYHEVVSDADIYNNAKSLVESQNQSFISYLNKHQDKLSKKDNTRLVKTYISTLERNIDEDEELMNELFSRYKPKLDKEKLIKEYNLSLDDINNPDYIANQNFSNSECKVEETIIGLLDSGYKFDKFGNRHKIFVDYQQFIDLFDGNILNEYRDYLKILSLNSEKPYITDEELTISLENLAERIILSDNFKLTYPYSNLIGDINKIHREYLDIFLHPKMNSEILSEKGINNKEKLYKEFKSIRQKYPHTYLADIIDEFIKDTKS